MTLILQLLLIVTLILINAFFAAAEMAIVSVDRYKILKKSNDGDKKAEHLLGLIDEPNKFLATIQVGITLAGFFSSASAATGMSGDLSLFLTGIGMPYSNQISVIIITIILSYFILVFGELFPKRIALKNPEGIAMLLAGPISIIGKVVRPFVAILSISTNSLMRLFKINSNEEKDTVTEDEIKTLLSMARAHGTVKKEEAARINSIFQFDDTLVKDVMIPSEEVFMIDVNKPLSQYMGNILEKMYSRIPVYDTNPKKIVGVLLIKDLLRKEHNDSDINQMMIKPTCINEDQSIDQLFLILQKARKHMAIIIDKHKNFTGIVTLEDLIEEVFGDIEDEFDQ